MLAHGFRLDERTHDWKPEEGGSMGYGVVPIRGGKVRAAFVVVAVLVIALIVVIALVVGD